MNAQFSVQSNTKSKVDRIEIAHTFGDKRCEVIVFRCDPKSSEEVKRSYHPRFDSLLNLKFLIQDKPHTVYFGSFWMSVIYFI